MWMVARTPGIDSVAWDCGSPPLGLCLLTVAATVSDHVVARTHRGSHRDTALAWSRSTNNLRGWKGASNAGRTHRRRHRQGHFATSASDGQRSAEDGDVVPGRRLGLRSGDN